MSDTEREEVLVPFGVTFEQEEPAPLAQTNTYSMGDDDTGTNDRRTNDGDT
jgi:hypothetical protein